jgi:hypothetical protein
LQSNVVRGAIAALLVAIAVVLFIVLSENGSSDGDGSVPTTTRGAGDGSLPTIRLRDGEPVGGVQELTVPAGDRVRFRVTSDTAGELHVHGYDLEKPIAADGAVDLDFPARLEGGFEVELHHGGGESQIAELRIEPQ